MKKLIAILITAAAAAVAYGDVSAIIQPVGTNLKDQNGATIAQADGLFMLIADTGGDGLDGYGFGDTLTLNLTDTFNTDDDVLFYSAGYAADDIALGSVSQLNYSGITAGQDYYAVWSDGSGWAGTHHIGTDVNWDVPSSGGTVAPSFVGYGDLNTAYAAIPEPASVVLLALAGAGLIINRNRNHRLR